MDQPTDARVRILAHLDAFNRRSTADLVAGLASDARRRTGTSTATGHAALAELFDEGLWAMNPSLRVVEMVREANAVALRLREDITINGVRQSFPIAAFYRLRDGLIQDVTIYREGSADLT